MTDLRTTLRLAAILLFGSIAIYGAISYRRSNLPASAPVDVQASGLKIIRQELRKIEASPFGRSDRGQALILQIRRLMASDKIIFSSGLGGPRGQTSHNIFGKRCVYIKVIEMNHGRYLHQLPWQLSEALFHEAVHAQQESCHKASFEEECDAFAAGLQAEAVSKGVALSPLLCIDGLPVAKFVRQSYPGIKSNAKYKPIGNSREWLIKHVEGEF